MISYQDRYPITFRFGVTKIFISIIIEGAAAGHVVIGWRVKEFDPSTQSGVTYFNQTFLQEKGLVIWPENTVN